MRAAFALLLLALPLLAGCPSADMEDGVPKKLLPVVSTFEDVVRWGDLNKIYAFGGKDNDWEPQPGLVNVRVTGYEATHPNEIEPWRWGVTAVIDYVWTDRQVVRQLVDQQVWKSDDEGESWYRANDPPTF